MTGAVVVLGAAWVWSRRREASRYRRESLTRLRELIRRMRDAETRPDALAALPHLVRQTCEGFAEPEALQGLSGQEFLEFLDSTWPGGSFADGPGRVMATLSYSNRAGLRAVSEQQALELAELVRRWIREHRRPLQRMASAESRS